jgi:hypothetical protein
MNSRTKNTRSPRRFAFPLILAAIALGRAAWAQTNNTAPAVLDNDTLKKLLQRIDSQEAEIQSLKAQLNGVAANAAAAAAPAMPPPPSYPNLQFHGFGDLDYAADNRRGESLDGVSDSGVKNSFFLGEFDLFLTSQLSEDFSALNETVLSAGTDNNMGLDIERLLLQYHPNAYFNVDLGRFHTALGYYNTAYHHGTWFQNAVGRPSFLEYEDAGGILPIHTVGLSFHGAIPSGKWNLNYFVEIGNGTRFSTVSGQNAVQQVIANTDTKAVNLALIASPDWLQGTEFGIGTYYDRITPEDPPVQLPDYDQFIFNAHVAFHNALWEFLLEGYLIDDTATQGGGGSYYSPAFFVQLSRKFGLFTPYARFTYYNCSENDPLWSEVWNGGANAGIHYGPSLGLRYDISTYVALKAQYDYLIDHGLNDASRLTLQAAFTF